MATPTCSKCGSTSFYSSKRNFEGTHVLLIYCTKCGTVVGAATAKS